MLGMAGHWVTCFVGRHDACPGRSCLQVRLAWAPGWGKMGIAVKPWSGCVLRGRLRCTTGPSQSADVRLPSSLVMSVGLKSTQLICGDSVGDCLTGPMITVGSAATFSCVTVGVRFCTWHLQR